MRLFLLGVMILLGCALRAQSVYFLNEDSSGIHHVVVSDIVGDETAVSDKTGRVDLSIFEEDQFLVVSHSGYQEQYLSKRALVSQEKIVLQKGHEIGTVEIPVISKTKESKYELITQATSITKHKIEQQAPATSADMLENTGQVLVQKSQFGGGSPIIRGFEASRVLLVVDGVRMNNAIYRNGHLQNAITIDPSFLEGTEVIFGPNSLIYGSDALGGVVHFKTRDPKLKTDSNSITSAHGFIRYQSVSSAKTAHVRTNFGTEKMAFLVGITRNEFGDLKMGRNRWHGYDNLGRINNYVGIYNDVDSLVSNPNDHVHVGSGYTQTDLYAKAIYKPKRSQTFKLNVQRSTSSNIPRFDKLNEYRDGLLRFSEWDYGPQNRTLVSLISESDRSTPLFDWNSTVLAYQKINESRISRMFQSEMRDHQEEEVSVYSLNSDYIKYLDSSRTCKLNFGFEGLYNDVVSEAYSENIFSSQRDFLETRYPGGGSNYVSGAVYAALQKRWKKHLIKGGARYTISQINAVFDTNRVVNLLDLSAVQLNNQSVTSSAGYVYHFKNHKLYTSVSSAFKSPNIDDFAKIFEKKGSLTIPNANLKPETSVSSELGASYSGDWIDYDLAGFYTRVFDMMLKSNIEVGGESTIVVSGDTLNLVSNLNTGTADIYGVFGAFRLKLNRLLSFNTTATITRAHFVGNDEPVPHIPPFYGRSSLDYKTGKIKLSLYARYNGLKKWSESSTLADNPDEGVEGVGTPAWHTWNLSAFFYPFDRLRIQAAVENIFDVHYKPFASGISGPGRNFVATVYFVW